MSSTDDKCFNKQRIISDTLFCCFCLCLVVCVNNYRLKYILVIQNLKKKHYYYLLLKIRIKIKNQQTQFASITYQRREDGEEDGDGRGIAGHLCYRGDDDAGDRDSGKDWQITQRCQQLGHPQRQARHLH